MTLAAWRLVAAATAMAAIGCGDGDGGGAAGGASQARCTVSATAGGRTRVIEVSDDESARSVTATYDGGRIDLAFDAEDRLQSEVREDSRGPVVSWARTFTHDALGNLTRQTGEASFPAAFENEYDPQGRLVRVRWTEGVLSGTEWSYAYDAAGRVRTVVTSSGDGTARTVSVAYGDGVTAWADGDYEYLATYDAAGRVLGVQRDGAYQSPVDGVPDVLQTWERDAAGSVRRFTQDGTDSVEQTGVDGTPEIDVLYDACAPLGARHPWIYAEASPPLARHPASPDLHALD